MIAEHVRLMQLKLGNVYFKVDFVDEQRTIPRMVPLVFAGRDLDGATRGDLFFQDCESYRRGARFDSASTSTFAMMGEGELSGVFELEQAIRCLEQCVDARPE